MEWDRRAFVKLAVGAALGVGASPLLPKLTDDVAIWTQNWSWVPQPENGAVAFANTSNPATGSGVKVRMINSRMSGERLIRVEGNPEHPLCKGGVVPEDASALQLLYNDAMRVPGPTMRDPKTNAPHQVTWKQAVGRVADTIAELFVAGKAHKVCIIADDPHSAVGEMLRRIAASLGTPNLVFLPDARQTLALAGTLMMGQPDIGFDLENADYVVSFGTPLFEGFGAPVATRKALAAWRGGKKKVPLVQVEPRASVTASLADHWLACKPGTEGAVALGIAQLLVASGAIDGSAASGYGFGDVTGQPGFKSMLMKDYTPAKVAKISGVPAAKLKAVAQGFATAKKPLAVCGPDSSGGPGRLYDFMAVLALNALKGRIGQPGGVVLRKPLPLSPLGPGLPVPKSPALSGSDQNPLGLGDLATLCENGTKGKPYKPEVVIIAGANPAFNGPQAKAMADFIDAAGMVVSISPFMDETAHQADVTLPATTFLEGWGDMGTPYGAAQASYGIHRPLIKVNKAAVSAGQIVLALAHALGGPVKKALPYKNFQAVLKARTAKMGGFDKLAEKGFWAQAKPAYGNLSYKTRSGKFEFMSQDLYAALTRGIRGAAELAERLEKNGVMSELAYAFMPHFEAPAALGMVNKHYPLLMAGAASVRTATGPAPTSPYMIKILYNTTLIERDKLVVEINPATAKDMHLGEGEMVEITSEAGSIKAKVHLFAGAAPGMVFVPQGLGHSTMGGYLEGVGDNFQNAVVVTKDALSGQPQWDLSPVMVKKAGGVSHV